jgi:flagellar biosynthetic protein FliR
VIFLGLGRPPALGCGLLVESYSAVPARQHLARRRQSIDGLKSRALPPTCSSTAVAIALPVTLVLLLVQVATGVLSRSAPALNLFALGLPAGILAGIAALIAAAPLYADQFTALSEDALRQAGALLAR